MPMPDLRWADVEPLPSINGDTDSVLAWVESLKSAWMQVVANNEEGFREARKRSLRRHAIETGIIERLYDVDWGVTEALVAEGLTADVAARSPGSIDEDVLDVISSQYDALTFLAEVAREQRPLTVYFVRELHVALTRTQPTYTATGPTGRRFQATLHHGEWKTQPNHVTRADGSTLEYTPPDHVQAQMDQLIALYDEMTGVHPLVRAAWLHHRFVRIHPFEDGNGRVARGLTLLTLLSDNLAPLVVDRRERDRYIRCLDDANEGDLRPLIRFFAELEIVVLRSEIERPTQEYATKQSGGALAVLDAHIEHLRALQSETGAEERRERVERLASTLHLKLVGWMEEFAEQVQRRYLVLDPAAEVRVLHAAPPDVRARWWRRQVLRTARSVDFFVNLSRGVWWCQLRVGVRGQRLRYLVFLQKVGQGESGVLTMTVFAEVLSGAEDDVLDPSEPIAISSPTESVTWTFLNEPDDHWERVERLLDDSLVVTLDRYSRGLS